MGVVAQVHPEVVAAFDIEEPVFLFELWFEPLTRAIPERPDYVPPSRYPEARRDLALLVPAATPAAALLEVIRSHRVRGVRINADVFDEYRGAGVPAGQKSLALAVRFRADDRTLSERDVVRIEQGLLRRPRTGSGRYPAGVTPPPALDPAVGLCSLCRYARSVRSGRGSRFWLCERAAEDASLRKYPALPRVSCHAFAPVAGDPLCEGSETG